MFDLSWSEIMVIAVAAIIFIGPKELPTFLRLIGRWTAKARSMAREFQGHVDDMVREAELDEVRQQVEKAGSEISRDIEKTVDPKGEVTSALAAPDLSGSPLDPTPAPPTAELPAPSPVTQVEPAAPAVETPAAAPVEHTAPVNPQPDPAQKAS
jgi:sec-independent protein translocase protein TatB